MLPPFTLISLISLWPVCSTPGRASHFHDNWWENMWLIMFTWPQTCGAHQVIGAEKVPAAITYQTDRRFDWRHRETMHTHNHMHILSASVPIGIDMTCPERVVYTVPKKSRYKHQSIENCDNPSIFNLQHDLQWNLTFCHEIHSLYKMMMMSRSKNGQCAGRETSMILNKDLAFQWQQVGS